MRLSKNFLNDYVDVKDKSFKEIADKMTFLGNEYDEYLKMCDCTNLVIGKVIDVKKHPESNKLNICKVDIGNEIRQILCGAANVKQNHHVIVAKVGATLPGGVNIKNSKLAGYDSEGMICSLLEVGIESKYLTEEDINGIHVLPEDSEIGEDPIAYLGLNDEVIDFDLTANRSDLLSVLGMAYEIGALYDLDVKMPESDFDETNESIKDSYHLSVETEDCPIYLAKLVKNIKLSESPRFIRNRLIASGIRPINNVVDISNYVMLETGQPLHFFDADTLGSHIIVRDAKEKETLITLDNKERLLSSNDIVIANEKGAVGLAGVMGGLNTEVTNNTKNIIIESAQFASAKIRNTSKRILRSEASRRFEKGIAKERTYLAIARACYLLSKYASGEVAKDMLVHDKIEENRKQVSISLEKINTILGYDLKVSEVSQVFDKLKFDYKVNNDNFVVDVPARRLDISIEEDLIEEVGRIVGYDRVVGVLPKTSIKVGSRTPKMEMIRSLHYLLKGLGFNQTITYSLISEEESAMFVNDPKELATLLEPISQDRKIMRNSLIPSLINVFNYNNSRNNKNMFLFEIGSNYYKENDSYKEVTKLAVLASGVYNENKWQKTSIVADFYLLKGIAENVLNYLGLNNRYDLVKDNNLKDMHPGRSAKIILDREVIGFIGEVHPSISTDSLYIFELDLDKIANAKTKRIRFKEPSKYPTISKDVSFIVDKDVEAKEIGLAIKKVGSRLLQNIDIFDVYTGNKIESDKKAIAYSLTFKDETRTLSDEEVMVVFNNIIEYVTTKFNAKLRNE